MSIYKYTFSSKVNKGKWIIIQIIELTFSIQMYQILGFVISKWVQRDTKVLIIIPVDTTLMDITMTRLTNYKQYTAIYIMYKSNNNDSSIYCYVYCPRCINTNNKSDNYSYLHVQHCMCMLCQSDGLLYWTSSTHILLCILDGI